MVLPVAPAAGGCMSMHACVLVLCWVLCDSCDRAVLYPLPTTHNPSTPFFPLSQPLHPPLFFSAGEFPGLQTKMRAVLRVEVEAVRFLKEEPHKMDSMLKRVKALTETLSCLRRCASGRAGLVYHTK